MATKINFSSLDPQPSTIQTPPTTPTLPTLRPKLLSHLSIPRIPNSTKSDFRLYFIFDAFEHSGKADWSIENVKISTVMTKALDNEILTVPNTVMLAFAKLPAEAKAAWNRVVSEVHERGDMGKRVLLMQGIDVLGELRFAVRAVAIDVPEV